MTNNTTSPTSDADVDELLRLAHYSSLMELMPVIVFYGVMNFIGLTGNVITIMYYSKKAKSSSTFTFITSLASVDLFVCVLIFTTIADMCVNVYFNNRLLCKFMYFSDHWIVVSSVLILALISIDRHRKMCKPFDKQFTQRKAFIAVCVLIFTACMLSLRDFLILDIVTVNFETSKGAVVGHHCTNTDDADLQVYIAVFYSLDALMIAAIFVTFVYTYGNIWRTLRQHKKTLSVLTQSIDDKDITADGDTVSKECNGQGTNADDTKVKKKISFKKWSVTKKDKSFNKKSERRASKSPSANKISSSERNVTIMMLAVSVAFIVCFVPYFIVNIGIRQTTKTDEFELSGGVQFGLRLPFLNSIVNPIIFCVFNPEFRRFFKKKLFWWTATTYNVNDKTVENSKQPVTVS